YLCWAPMALLLPLLASHRLVAIPSGPQASSSSLLAPNGLIAVAAGSPCLVVVSGGPPTSRRRRCWSPTASPLSPVASTASSLSLLLGAPRHSPPCLWPLRPRRRRWWLPPVRRCRW